MTAYQRAKRKLALEQVGMAPFVWLGKLAAFFYPLKSKHRFFLFFPNADIGGTPKVNAAIAALLKQEHPLIIFSKKAHNNHYRELYEQTGVKILDIHRYIDYKAFHFINFFFRGLLAAWINKQNNAVVFGGESIFFYKVIPHLRSHVRCIELTHVDQWLPYNIGFIDRIDARVFSTKKGLEKVEAQYRENQIPEAYFEQLFFIDNAVDIPVETKNNNKQLQVFFIGRGAPQKRVHLAAAIAKHAHEKNIPATFHFVGDVGKVIDPAQYPYCNFHGTIKDDAVLKAIYQKADVLLLTSAFEGLPLVVMQMMAYGKVVVSTAVNGIPDYVHHEKNGLLITSTDELAIIEEGVSLIKKLSEDARLLQDLGAQARADAISQFNLQTFQDKYRQLFLL